jgi:hypothetical protein
LYLILGAGQHGIAPVDLKTRAPGDGHHYGPAGILYRPLTLSPGG